VVHPKTSRANDAALHALAQEPPFGFADVSAVREYHGRAADCHSHEVGALDREILVDLNTVSRTVRQESGRDRLILFACTLCLLRFVPGSVLERSPCLQRRAIRNVRTIVPRLSAAAGSDHFDAQLCDAPRPSRKSPYVTCSSPARSAYSSTRYSKLFFPSKIGRVFLALTSRGDAPTI
jgi:hypothetical protein